MWVRSSIRSAISTDLGSFFTFCFLVVTEVGASISNLAAPGWSDLNAMSMPSLTLPRGTDAYPQHPPLNTRTAAPVRALLLTERIFPSTIDIEEISLRSPLTSEKSTETTISYAFSSIQYCLAQNRQITIREITPRSSIPLCSSAPCPVWIPAC
jgi:hypothetical protein